ncbi:MAG: fumarate hydratase [Bacillota bacterium]|nr:fumarate hydratase [Bacillota bacterium]
MREVNAADITAATREMCIEACCVLPDDVRAALERARTAEESELGREVLSLLIENADIAAGQQVPLCQDTGLAIFYVEVGQEVHVTGAGLREAIDEGVRQGYRDGYLRKSVVADPFRRTNTGDNTPAVIYFDIVPGDRIKLTIAPKGAGSENMSALTMLTPADGVEGVRNFVVSRVVEAGANPCPPLVIGVGVGGTMEGAALLAKKSLVRKVGEPNPAPHLAQLEREILAAINDSGVGPQGLGGRTTALAVHVNAGPTHIACLPCAVNIQCHAARHVERVI